MFNENGWSGGAVHDKKFKQLLHIPVLSIIVCMALSEF